MAKSVLIHQSIWQSRVFTLVRDRAREAAEKGDAAALHFAQQTLLLANYLITNAGGNSIGLYGIDLEAAGEALILEPWEIEKHIAMLADVDFLTYDKRLFNPGHFRKTPFVWLHSAAKYQFDLVDARKVMAPGDRRVIGIRNVLDACPALTLVELFKCRYNLRCSLNYDNATIRQELAVREAEAQHLIGPPLDMIRSQGVRW